MNVIKFNDAMDMRYGRRWRLALGLVAAAALLVTAGCSAWRVREAAQLARESEPFQALPTAPKSSLLIVGDSTAVGTGASDPSRSVAGLIGQSNPGLRIVNRASDGAKYEDFARQLEQSTDRFDTVLVLGGGNDVIRLTSEDELRTQVRRVAVLAKQRGEKVILMPPGNVGNAPFFWPPLSWVMTRRSQTLHALVSASARETGASYVNLYKPKAEDPFAQRPKELHARDGLHPSDAGYELWLADLNQQAGLQAQLR